MPNPTTPKTPAAWLHRSPPRSFWRLPLAVAAVLVLANLIWYSLEVFEAVGKLVPEIEDVATVLDDTLMSWPTPPASCCWGWR